jgi:hypothetical protein
MWVCFILTKQKGQSRIPDPCHMFMDCIISSVRVAKSSEHACIISLRRYMFMDCKISSVRVAKSSARLYHFIAALQFAGEGSE